MEPDRRASDSIRLVGVDLAAGPEGAIWELDISPDGERLAAVDIVDHRLYVWNISDGRVLLWVGHSKAVVDVVWLSNDWVLVADGETGWYSYEVIDDGSA